MLTKQYNIDMTPGGVQVIVPLNQYENDVTLQFHLFTRDGSLSIESGTTAAIRGTKKDGLGIDTVTGVSLSGNTVTVQVTEQMTAIAGRNVYELCLEKGNKKLFSSNIVFMVERAALDKDTVSSQSEIRQIIAITERTDEIIAAANKAEVSCASVEENTLIAKASAEAAKASEEESQRAEETVIQKAEQILLVTTDADTIAKQALQKANNAENESAETTQRVEDFNRTVLSVESQLLQKVDGAYVENGYLYLTSNGEIVAGPLGPFSGTGGGGSGSDENKAVCSMANNSGWISKTISTGAECLVKLTWSSVEDEMPTGPGTIKITVNGVLRSTQPVQQGYIEMDIGPYCATGTNSVRVNVSDQYGNGRTINFTVTAIALSISSSFDVSSPFTGAISFTYTPVGSVPKIVHFVLDGAELETTTTSVSNRQMSYLIPAQEHGAHTLRCYFEAEINGETVRSNELYYEFISVEQLNDTPIIMTSFHQETAKQYSTLQIGYTVYTPNSFSSDIEIQVNGTAVSHQSVDRTEQIYSYRAQNPGEITVTIISGEARKDIAFTIIESDIHPIAEEEALKLFLSSYGRSNNEANPRTWAYEDIAATLTGFNFTSDGWQRDSDGITVLRVSGDARVEIPYKPFALDFRSTGKTIELEFATRNILNYDSTIISCVDGNRGFTLTAQRALLKSEQSEISTQYKEDEHVRVSFIVEKQSENRLIFIYINGIASGVVQYPESDDFSQVSPKNITIGSNDCTLDLYCIRIYDNDLTRFQVVNNWIADTQVGELMIERYNRNDVYDDYGQIVISKLPGDLPYMILEAEQLPQYKGDKKTVSGSFTNPILNSRSFTFEGAQADVQGTSSQYYPRKNYKVKFKKGFTMANGQHEDGYAMNDDAIPTSTFTFKADVASSEGANNVELVRLYNDACPYKTSYQEENPKVRQGIDGFPMVMFYNSGDNTTFVGKYNFNNDKGTEEVFGFQEGDESWEIKNNTGDRVIWKSDDYTSTKVNEDGKVVPAWLDDFEGRYPDGNENPINLKALATWLKSTDQAQATGAVFETPVDFGETEQIITKDEQGNDIVTYRSIIHDRDDAAYRLAKFKAELPDHMEVQAVLFYYLFTELFLMVDSRAKNAFPTFMGGSKWFSLPYDFDTAIGINNEGSLVFGYELEDIDHTEGGADVYNGQDSVLWVNIRGAFYPELAQMYKSLRSSGALSYTKVEKMFEDHQAKWPEVIFNEDAWFKYIMPLTDPDEDAESKAAYLKMLQGSKAEQRKWWLYNRFRYIDSKYNAGDALTDVITVRGYAKADITVRPYADIYPSIKYGSYLVQKRGKRGTYTTLECPLDRVNDTEIYIYSASQLASVGDLSGLKVGLADFASATRLQELKLGNADPAYSNGNLNDLTLGNNVLLKTLDVRNCPALTQTVDLKGCTNIEEIYFDGSSITGVELPNGGALRILHLPGTITNLTIQNQTRITDFTCPSLENLTTLRLENVSSVINPLELTNQIQPGSRVRILGFSFTAADTDEIRSFMDHLDTFRGLDENGQNMDTAQVLGTIHVEYVTGAELVQFAERYPNITVTYDHITSNLYYYDFEGETLIHTETIVDGGDGTYDGEPSKEPTAANTYEFIGWSKKTGSVSVDADALLNVTADRRVYAAYKITGQTYRVRFYTGTTILQVVSNVPYGGRATYTSETPYMTGVEDPEDYEFIGWSPAPENIQGNTDCFAEFRYTGFVSLRFMERNMLGPYENNRVTTIGTYAFYKLTKITSVSFENVTSIGSYAFSGANKIEFISFPKAVEIGQNAFEDCSSIKEISLPMATDLGTSAFRNCIAAKRVSLPSIVTLSNYAVSITGAEEIILGDALEKIGDYCFQKNAALTKLKLGPNVLSIGNRIIANSGVTEIKLSRKPTTKFSPTAFSEATELTDIYVPWSEGEMANAPWGAPNATVHYEYDPNSDTE